MGYGYGYGYGGGWGAGTFWLFIAAAVISSAWEKVRRNAERHETLRRIIEKTGTVDEAKLKELFNPSGPEWMRSVPGEAFRGLRIAGTIVLWRRLLQVWSLLMQGQSLSEAAHAVGCADSAHLSRTSRAMFGTTPSALRMSGPLSQRERLRDR